MLDNTILDLQSNEFWQFYIPDNVFIQSSLSYLTFEQCSIMTYHKRVAPFVFSSPNELTWTVALTCFPSIRSLRGSVRETKNRAYKLQ